MRRMRLSNIIMFVLIALAAFLVFRTCRAMPSLQNIFSSRPEVIDETPIIIKEIREIGQLITAVSSDEVVVESTLPTRGSGFVNSFNKIIKVLPSADKRIVLIGRGKVVAGTDLKQLKEDDVSVSGDTIRINIPKAVVLDAILNPSDFETFEERGNWSSAEIIEVKKQARLKMVSRALQHNILSTADKKAKEMLRQFLYAAGFKEIIIN